MRVKITGQLNNIFKTVILPIKTRKNQKIWKILQKKN